MKLGVLVCFRDRSKKLPPQIPGEIGHFSSFDLIFHLSLPKIWLTHHMKSTFLKAKIALSILKDWYS